MTWSGDLAEALAPSVCVDSDHPDVIAFAKTATGSAGSSPAEVASALFRAVRDHVWYDPYGAQMTLEAMRASTAVNSERSWCVPKAVLFAAACRVLEIPALVGFADVRNHLSTPKLLEVMGTDVFAWHGYTAVLVAGEWRKASPAFNAELCERFGVAPLEFDGTADALLHPFDGQGNQYMEYLVDHGVWPDVPLDEMLAGHERVYDDLPERLMAAARNTDDGFVRP